jgi:class 3 adenylate cyclase
MGAVETVTILFTDLVGSTGLETRVGPSAANELRSEHFGLIRTALEQTGGREVKNTGDGVMAAFESASSAVSCAVAVQQAFERRNRQSDVQLLVRVGLSLGDATAADGDYFGLPVIEAARLCDKAQGGQILAREIVAHLSAGRDGHSFNPVGELALKGIPDPLGAVEVAWEPLGTDAPALPLPWRLQELPPGAFVGRQTERERLSQLLAEAGEGRRLVLLAGEPGIGKTRLSTHTALEARSQGATVLYGRADEDLAIPYGPWIEALRHYVDHAPEAALRAHAERHGGELARLVPELEGRIADLPAPRETDPDTERYLLWGAVLGLLQSASAGSVVVLVLDDLHWADKPTLQLLKHVMSQEHELRALIIGTYRESDIGRGHPLQELLADLRREQGVERIALSGLGGEDIVALMENAAGHALDESGQALAAQLLRETGGNAFFTGEILRHLVESEAIYQDERGRWRVSGELSDMGLPESVREVLGRRIEGLGEDARLLLSIAAVIGREFDVELLVRVADGSEDALLDLLERSVTASVLSESASVPGRFSFAHALINHTLYDELGTTRRARIHRRVAEALEDMLGSDPGERVAELARHWGKATTAVDLGKAISYARMAGERALAELAPDEALRWFSQALELDAQRSDPDLAERCDVLTGLGEAQRQVGDQAFRETLLEASRLAAELGDADRAAAAALSNNRGLQSAYGAVDIERFDALARALELAGPDDPARRARLISRQALELQLGPEAEHGQRLAFEAIALARACGDRRALAHVLRDSALVLQVPGVDLGLRRELVDELGELAADLADPTLRFWAAHLSEFLSVVGGDLARAGEDARRRRALADDVGAPAMRWFSSYVDACHRLLRGDLAEAERLSKLAFQIGAECGEPDAAMTYGGQVAVIRYLQGRTDRRAQDLLEQVVEANPGIVAWQGGLAQSLCSTGRFEDAAPLVAAARQDRFAAVPHDLGRPTALAYYADAVVALRDTEAAEILYGLMEPWGDRVIWNDTTCSGATDLYRGELAAVCGWDERADEHLRSACEFHEQGGMLVWAALSHVVWGEALAARGEGERARAEAARALELAREHGYGLVEGRASALIETGSAAPS